MILTTCAACAAPLAHDAPTRCVSCQTRYCSDRCHRYDRRRGGHGKICGAIASGGGAEQYHADKKYEEAVADAVEACAVEEGQTCYICLEGGSEEGLVRGCSCRGAAGYAHVSCLAEQAKILWAEAEENNLGAEARSPRWARWSTCGLCEQDYHGLVACALGWACWKTFVGRPEEDGARQAAMTILGNGLYEAQLDEAALSVGEAELSMYRRVGTREADLLVAQGNLACAYHVLGRHEEALDLRQEVYAGSLNMLGEENENTLVEANNYAYLLTKLKRFEEARSLLRKVIPVAQRVLGESNEITIRMRHKHAEALCQDNGATLDDLREGVTLLEDLERTARRVLGGAHPLIEGFEDELQDARAALRARETPSPS